MGRGKKAQDAKAVLFKRLYGVKPGTFQKMLSILQKEFDAVSRWTMASVKARFALQSNGWKIPW
jgi:hypothetical protein